MLASESRPSIIAPRPPEVPPLRRFPLVATLAPVVASAALFAVTRSAFALVFALLGPVVALGTLVDSGWQRRRTRSREERRFADDLARVTGELDAAHAAERAELDRQFPRARSLGTDAGDQSAGWRASADGGRLPARIRLGTGDLASSVVIDWSPASVGGHADARLVSFRAKSATLVGAPVAADIGSGVAVVGSGVSAMAAARGIILQLAERMSPASTTVVAPTGSEWDWLDALPHPVRRSGEGSRIELIGASSTVAVTVAGDRAVLPQDAETVVRLTADGNAQVVASAVVRHTGSFLPELVGLESATLAAAALAGRAGAAASAIPEAIEFAELPHAASVGGLAAVIGIGHDEPVVADLVRDGPHAIVGGTTGSGKSELLVTWVLAMGARSSPEAVTFLFVDYKGGAAFDPLAGLPHSVGIITDLDAAESLRALASLTAELRFRERELAARGLRSIADAGKHPPFPRLVVVVDEYAAVVETHSTLHSVFADIAARGRSLGVHLILCTQRPAGVVRDGILANCALRLSLRVLTRSDSSAVIGTDDASRLASAPPGRAFIAASGEPPKQVQIARAAPHDIEAVRAAWAGGGRPRVPWLPPLSAHISAETVDVTQAAEGIPFAMQDLPELQAQELVEYRPAVDGSLLVVGAAGSGKTGVLCALAIASTTTSVRLLPAHLPGLWDALDDAIAEVGQNPSADGGQTVFLLDDVDLILSTAEEPYQQAILDRIAVVLRSGRASGLHLVITVQRISGAIQSLAALCGTTLILRLPTQQEHVLAGGAIADFSDRAVPGSGSWRGHRVQVLEAASSPAGTMALRGLDVDLTLDGLAAVSVSPDQFAARLRALAPNRTVVVLGSSRFDGGQTGPAPAHGRSPILVADPETWQGHWTAFVSALRSATVLFDGCSATELRTLTRSRELPPPFPRGERTLWLRSPDGALDRARLPAPMDVGDEA